MTKQRIPARRRRIGWGVAAVVVGVGVFLFAATGCGGGESSDVPSFSADDLDRVGRRSGLDDERRRDLQPALLDARRDRHLERLAAQGRLAHASERRRDGGEVLGREPAHRPGRRHLHHRRQRRRLRRLGRQRQDPLAVQGESRPEDLDGLLRLAEPWRRDRRRPRLSRPARRQGARARPEDREPSSGRASSCSGRRARRSPARRSSSTGRSTSASSAPTSARAASSRRWTRRTAQRVALLHDPRAGRARQRDVAGGRRVRAGRRLDLDDARVRQGSEPALRHDGQRRQRLVRRRPAGRQPLRRVDPRDRPRHRAS